MRPETLKGHLDGMLLAALEPAPRHGLRDHGGAAGRQRRAVRPADRHRLSRPAPAGTRWPDQGRLVGGGRAAATTPSGPAPRHLVDSYLAEVTARLPGPARARASVVDELRAGLLDAIDAYRSAGLAAEQAAQAAVSEFG